MSQVGAGISWSHFPNSFIEALVGCHGLSFLKKPILPHTLPTGLDASVMLSDFRRGWNRVALVARLCAVQSLSEPPTQFSFRLDLLGCHSAPLLSNGLNLTQVGNPVIPLGTSGSCTDCRVLPLPFPLSSPPPHLGSPACFHGPVHVPLGCVTQPSVRWILA